MNLNKIVGFLLVIQGTWMTIDGKIGFGFVVNREAHGLGLYGYTVPLILLGIYMIFFSSNKQGK